MISLKNNIIQVILISFTVIFVIFDLFKIYNISNLFRILIIPLYIYFYINTVKNKNKHFLAFLILYAIAEMIGGLGSLMYNYFQDDFLYFTVNIAYVLAYTFLMISILEKMSIKAMLNKYLFQILVLLVLDIYCVVLITDITINNGQFFGMSDKVMEVTYNTIIMLLMTIALINYVKRDSKKSMNLLLGAMFITFSEVMQVAYYYITESSSINLINLAFLILAFYFLYCQAKYKITPEEVYKNTNKLNL